MNKKTKPELSPWGDEPITEENDQEVVESVKPTKKTKEVKADNVEPMFDLEGLMTDFPTAKELEQFVYDRTGIVLNLKGRSNKFKYQTAMDVLNGQNPDPSLLGNENPYLSKADMVPVDPVKELPKNDPTIADAGPEVNKFDSNMFPHPDPELKAQDQKCLVTFRKYANGMITYEIIGPVTQRAVGERVNKYGQRVPEKYVWIDPRTGEQVIVRGDGSLTPLGTKIRAFMRRQRMNNSNMWDIWIDRDFVVREDYIIDNPWGQ